jgi:aryl-alcohol dehydrogenase-like predicted oxidoreductase
MLPIPGTSSLAHLEENISSAFFQLTEPELEQLDSFDRATST